MNKRVIERNMFYGAKKNIFQKAADLRNNMTLSEEKLWEILHDRKVFKVKFRRQHPIDIFIADFYCHSCKLAIEIDGGVHLDQEVMDYDEERTYILEKYGITVIRFKNEEVLYAIERVKETILNAIALRSL